MTRLRVFTHPSGLWHDPGPGHPESPARLAAILDALRTAPFADRLDLVEPEPASRATLERVHPAGHLDGIERLATGGGGRIDEDTVVGARSWVAAVHAAGAALGAARSALDGVPAFAAMRPPGHHATADRAMGFCLINNVVVAGRAALEDWGLDRVLIVDWDVHHGNGTQDLVWDDPRLRYISLHQWPLYPGTGRDTERGAHDNVVNLPRPPGLPPTEYVAALDEAVRTTVSDWEPQLLLVSAGFDAMAGDPLAGFTLEPADYAEWVRRWRAFDIPIASVLEGGYAPDRIAAAVVAHGAALVA